MGEGGFKVFSYVLIIREGATGANYNGNNSFPSQDRKQNQLTNNLVRLLYPSYRDFFRMAVFVYICLLAFPLHPACSVLLELLE